MSNWVNVTELFCVPCTSFFLALIYQICYFWSPRATIGPVLIVVHPLKLVKKSLINGSSHLGFPKTRPPINHHGGHFFESFISSLPLFSDELLNIISWAEGSDGRPVLLLLGWWRDGDTLKHVMLCNVMLWYSSLAGRLNYRYYLCLVTSPSIWW